MLKRALLTAILATFLSHGSLFSHCQMPCGIYHDDMVYNLVDQYVETMFKGISVLNNSKFATVKERNEFVRWVMEKDKSSDQTAHLISEYFLQQKIKVGGDDTTKQLISAHKLLFMLMQIKQGVDLELVRKFQKEWDQFKLMFHREDYECEMEQVNVKKYADQKARAIADHDHHHDHNHPHDHDHDHDHDDHDHTH
jgi:nickel superoxide dismutase